MRCPAQGSAGGCVMPGLVFKWFGFLCVIFSIDTLYQIGSIYLMLPKVSSLVVLELVLLLLSCFSRVQLYATP